MKSKKLVLLFIAIFVLGIFTGGIVAYGKNTEAFNQTEETPEPPKSPEEMTEEELAEYVDNLDEEKENTAPDTGKDDSRQEDDKDNKDNNDNEEDHSDSDTPDAIGVVRPASSNNVNVRAGASKDYAVVAKVKPGDEVKIIGQSEDWYEVELQDGTKGWMADFLLDVDWGMDNV